MGISKDSQQNVRNMTNLIKVDNKKIRSIIYEYIQKIYTTNSSKYFFILSPSHFLRFRNNVKIRLDYAVFLARSLKHRQSAISQIEQGDLLEPIIDEQFKLFLTRFNKFIIYSYSNKIGNQLKKRSPKRIHHLHSQNSKNLMKFTFIFENYLNVPSSF